MQIEIYVDSLFFINFLMIFFIFYCVNKLDKHKIKLSRLALTSIISSFLYCLIVIFVKYNIILNYILNFLIIVTSVIFCFRPSNLKILAILLLKLILISLFIVGICIYLYFFNFNPLIFVSQNLNFSLNKFPFKILFLSTLLSYVLIKICFNYYNRIIIKKQVFYNVKIYKNQKFVNIKCLLDTGNSLKDPMTNKSVIIAEFEAIKNILPNKIKFLFSENNININNISDEIRIIPFKSIGKEKGMLLGIKVDQIEIDNKHTIKDVIIGICNFSLCKDGFYNAILGPELINNLS